MLIRTLDNPECPLPDLLPLRHLRRHPRPRVLPGLSLLHLYKSAGLAAHLSWPGREEAGEVLLQAVERALDG